MDWQFMAPLLVLAGIVLCVLFWVLKEVIEEINDCLSSLKYFRNQHQMMQDRAWEMYTNGHTDYRGRVIDRSAGGKADGEAPAKNPAAE